jgi:peptidoglycan/LPS O-acetylase OafA/YrhL
MKQNRYTFLDGLRGLAAIFVLTGHTGDYWHFGFFRAYLAVDLFFILSGFVIAHAYEAKLQAGIISVPGFLKVRLIRLYPVFLLSVPLCTVTLIGAAIANHDTSAANFLAIGGATVMTLLFLPYHIAGNTDLFPLNGAYWSLFFELVANASYAFARPRLNTFGLLAIIGVSGLGIVVLAFVHGDLDAGFKWTLPHIGAGFLRSIFGIFVGVFLYRNHGRLLKRFEKISPWLAFAIVGIILASPSTGSFDAVIDIMSVCFIFPVCVLVASRNADTALEAPLLMLGSASYPIYVLHAAVAKIILYAWPGLGAYAPLSGIVFVAILIGASIWLEKNYDIPLRRRLTNTLVKRVA